MRFGVLGPVEVRDGKEIVKIGGPQQQRLLAVLLAQPGHVIETHRLVDVLWPDDMAPDGAARSVLTYVHRLRSAVGNDTIVTRGSGYAFEPAAGELDADLFEALVASARAAGPDAAVARYDEALALWRGRAFGTFADEWWALAPATRLDELRAVAAEERATALVATGNRARAIPDLQQLVAEYPLRERPACLLAHALFATGRQVEAVRELSALRERLADSGLDPSGDVLDLEREIIGGEEPAASSAGGRPLRGYVVHDAIGEGNHGRVYVATQPGTNRRVAIKMIRPELADASDFVARFEAEAQLVARLEHPHIVPLYDYWREPGGAYLVFRLLKRSVSASLVTGGPWSLEHVSQLVEEIGSALLTAHAAGVEHGDVRAANVLLDDNGSTYLTDFGIAIASNGASPTVARDIADFAALVWELLTGAPPGEARRPLPSLAGRVRDVPDTIDAVLAEASSPNSAFGSMAEFILAWRAAVGRPEGVVTPLNYEQRAGESARRLAARDLLTAASAGINPYQGLRPFGEADAASFFGRTAAVAALAAIVEHERFIAVVGASGSGKSSLLHAGLIPQLRRAGAAVATMIPGVTPKAALKEALNELAVSPLRVSTSTAAISSVAKTVGDLVIVVDQFEECWTLAPEHERDEFLEALAQSKDVARVIVAVRADFYDKPLAHPAIGALVSTASFSVAPMTAAELDDAIVLPAARAGVAFDDGVVAGLVADATARPGALPMLQFTLAELYERRVDGRMTAAALEQLGGIAGSVGRRAEEIYGGLDPAEQAATREVFARLVTPGEGTLDTRSRARLGDLSDAGRAAVASFVSGRLLVTDREAETREPVIEIAHEALLTHWSRLRDWVEADRQWLRQLQHLALATHTWDDAGRPDAELYRGARLEAAIEALPDRRGELTPNEIAFVEAGQRVRDADREQERRVARRTRRLLGVVAGALVIALIAGAVAFVQRGNARDAADTASGAQRNAEIEALIGRIETLRSTQRDAAALLAIEAFKLADTPRTRAALLSTFTENPGYLDTHQLPPGNDLYFGVVMDDGKHAFVTTRDHVIRPYDLETGELGKPWPVMANKPLPFSWLQGSPDGTSLAQNSDNESQTGVAASTIGVFDVANGALRFPALQLPIGIGIILFSPDGKLLAAAGGTDETVTVFDAFTGRELGRYRGLDQPGDIRWGTAGISFLGNRQLAIGSIQGRVRIVDVPSMRVAREFPVPDATTQELSTLDGGRALLGIGLNGLIRFDATTGARTWFVPESRDSCSMYTVIESRNRVYCSDVFGRLDERDLGDGHVVRQLDAQKGAAGSLWPARNDTELVEFGNGATVVTRWRLDGTGPITRRLEPGAVASRYSPDGSQLIGLKVVGDARQFEPKLADAALLDARTGKVVDELEGIVSPGWITPDRLGGAVMDGDDFVLTQYDPVSKRRSPGIRLPGEGLSGGLNVGTGKTWMFYDRDKGKTEIQTIDVKTSRRVEPTFTVPSFAKADASADGSRFVVAAEDIIVYDTTTGKEVGRIKGHFLNGVHLTRNNVVFAWSLGGALKVYDLKTLKPIRELAGNRGYLVDVKSDARGGTIAASGGDRQVTLYDAATGVALGESITVADEESTLIALRPDARELAVGGSETIGMQVWDLDPQHWIAAACRVAGRNLTRAEWDSNIGALLDYRATCPRFT